MKKTVPALCILLLILLYASPQLSAQEKKEPPAPNLVKFNPMGLVFSNLSFQYERAITSRLSVLGGLNIMPKRGLPFSSLVEDLIDDQQTFEDLKNIRFSSWSITPEVRFYLSKKNAFRGFYLAPFARISSYTVDLPYAFQVYDQREEIPLNGSIQGYTAGLLMGAQFKIAPAFFLDWQILGPHYGYASGRISGKKELSAEEVAVLNHDLENLDIPMLNTTVYVDEHGGYMDAKGPWAGIRTSLAIGFRF